MCVAAHAAAGLKKKELWWKLVHMSSVDPLAFIAATDSRPKPTKFFQRGPKSYLGVYLHACVCRVSCVVCRVLCVVCCVCVYVWVGGRPCLPRDM